MRTTHRTRAAGLALALAVGGLAVSSAVADADEKPQQLTLQSGVSGGTWFPIGAGIVEIFSAEGVRANAEPGGAASNLVSLNQGRIELGFTMSILPELARRAAEPFPHEIEDTRGIAVLFPNFTHVLVRADSGVKSIEDLAGRRFASQPIGTGTQIAFADMLAAHGLSEDDLDLTRGGQTHGADQIRDGHAVGMTATTAAPGGTITELATVHDVVFLPLSDEAYEAMREINPGYVRTELPAGTYPGQDEAVPGTGTDTMLAVSESMPEEEVYWITRTLVENIERVQGIHASLAGLTPERMAAVEGLPLHPGAERYYEEHGLR